MTSQQIGIEAEQLALTYLDRQGLCLITQNYHSHRGEIDLIMSDDHVLVFIEVRYRRSDRFGSALESVSKQKQSRIIHTAQHYLQQHSKIYSGYRFDVIAISPKRDRSNIIWVKDAFQIT